MKGSFPVGEARKAVGTRVYLSNDTRRNIVSSFWQYPEREGAFSGTDGQCRLILSVSLLLSVSGMPGGADVYGYVDG